MNVLKALRTAIYPTADLRAEDARLEHTTRAVFIVIGLSLFVTLLAVLVLDLNAAQPEIWPIFLVLAILVVHSLMWFFLIQKGYWKTARFFPPTAFLIAGALLTSKPELNTAAVLQYVLCILLASILFDESAKWIAIAVSSGCYLAVLYISKPPVNYISSNIVYVNIVILVAIGVLQQITTGVITQTISQLTAETASRKKSEESALQKERILSVIADSAQLLLGAQDWKTKIAEMLELLGSVSGASHAYLFQNHVNEQGALLSSLKYEWKNPAQHHPSDPEMFQNVPLLEEDMIDWYNIIITGKPFYNSTEIFPPEWSEQNLERAQIKTLLDVPIFVDGEWWGVIGFDDFERIKPWSQAEVDALQIAAGLLGSAIKRQKSTDLLTASEEKFQKTFHETLVPMVIGRISDNIILDANHAFTKLTGFSKEEVINRWSSELNLWQNSEEHALHNRLIREHGFIHEFKASMRKRNGEIGIVLISVTVIKIDNEDCLLYTISDITGLEKALNDLQNKNSELERFTYTVSHDLKAPLITIGGFMGLLEKDLISGDVEKIRNSAQRIKDAVARMERLLNELLELSRIGRMINEPGKVPFQEIASEAVELNQGRLGANHIKVRIETDLPTVKVDRARMIEAIQNLLDNSAKFMGEQDTPEIVIGARRSMDGEHNFFVRDNGIGIEPVYHERVFGLFNKLDAKTEGTGIGLALVRRIIEYHGGHIWVESEGINKGSTFWFTLPRP
ncbi:MAG: PAS domain S-box protein [Anaerolineales bacterium]|uniref:GAF domain-containing sensor histidine kinase n=1 Tax=Candidatus Villigracilis vicinus TaxID=3140679 RepID=UPI0031372A32|nr:PAS domain S-box protein [Anaerolineales bacterium]